MKTKFLMVIFFICYKTLYSQISISLDSLVFSNNMLFIKGDSLPFSGTGVDFFTNNVKRVEVTYLRGKTHGITRGWFENGKIKYVGYYSDNSMEQGEYKEWYDNGKLHIYGNYLNGNRIGQWIEYYSNGKILFDGNFINGEKDGEWKVFDSIGDLLRIEIYLKGVLIESKKIKDVIYREYPDDSTTLSSPEAVSK